MVAAKVGATSCHVFLVCIGWQGVQACQSVRDHFKVCASLASLQARSIEFASLAGIYMRSLHAKFQPFLFQTEGGDRGE